jgi:hypothetical protein
MRFSKCNHPKSTAFMPVLNVRLFWGGEISMWQGKNIKSATKNEISSETYMGTFFHDYFTPKNHYFTQTPKHLLSHCFLNFTDK